MQIEWDNGNAEDFVTKSQVAKESKPQSIRTAISLYVTTEMYMIVS